VSSLCRTVGLSRQGYYKGRRERRRREVDEEALIELVKAERRVQPRLGARKLMVVLKDDMKRMGIRIGRDRFFALLRREGLLVARRRRRARTTDSRHSFRTYRNLYREADIKGVHEAWLSDLTYVRTDEGFAYVSLLSDAYSRKIVGYATERTLEATGSVRALRMALGQLPSGAHPLHHSDRGVQYCCWAYVERLEGRGLPISMTEEDHCYENAQAERLNGILKQEYGLGGSFRTRRQAREAVRQAVELYNHRRPHTALGYRTPGAVHAEWEAGAGEAAAKAAASPVALRAPCAAAAG
jgi:transposase InsO family protein